MPRFDPFPGLRYSPSHVRSLDDVVCPPYDVISDGQRIALEGRSPSNVVRLELPHDDPTHEEWASEDRASVEGAEGDTANGDGIPVDRYHRAGQLLDAWRDGGILHRDPEPAFYGYRMLYHDPAGQGCQTVGVIGALGVERPGQGILPHEETTPKAKTDRLDLLRATRVNISPIWGLSPAAGLSAHLSAPDHPVERAVDEDGIAHEMWPITDPAQVAAIKAAVESEPVLIADGHHRFETALNYQAEQQAAGRAGADEGAVMALVVELSVEQLTVQAIHRLLVGLPDGFDLAAALDKWFDVTPGQPVDRGVTARMAEAGALAVLTPTQSFLARPRPAVIEAATHDLDSSRLDVALADLPPHQVVYQHGWDNCAAAVASGGASAAVLLRPATVEQIAAISRGGVRMPPKTTFFWPKPRTGMVLRELLS